jgi:hypothetical protein
VRGEDSLTVRRSRVAGRLARTDRRLFAPLVLGAALVLAGAWLMYETRGTTLWFDEWQWVLEYDDDSLDGFIAPHNGHPTLIPVLIYRLLFATVGIDQSGPYRVVGIAGHLLVVAVLYVYAARRAGAGLALVAAALILFLGPGWQNIVWPLQIGWLVSIAAGLGALLMLDRRDRLGDVAAAGLVLLSIAASGPGVAIAIGLAVEPLRSRGLRAAWIVAVPLGLFAIWWLAYQDAGTVRRAVTLVPEFAADSAAATLSALLGLAGPGIANEAATLAWGRPLAVVAAALILWRLWNVRPVPTRVLTLLAVLAAFWALTGLQRAGIGPAESSRYLYVSAVFAVALAVELARGIAISPRAWLVIAAATGLVIVANIGDMRTGARFLREQALLTRTGLTALEIARPVVRPDHEAAGIAGYPLVVVRAGQYFALARDLGTPAASLAELAAAPESARASADEELRRMHGVSLQPAEPLGEPGLPPAERGPPPTADAATGGTTSTLDGCVAFAPEAAGPAEPAPAVEFTVPPNGLLLTADDGGATIKVRRFADGYADAPLARIAPGGTGLLAIRPDRAPNPWHVRVSPAGRLTACTPR